MKKRIATLLALTLIIALLLPGTLAWADGKTMDIADAKNAVVRVYAEKDYPDGMGVYTGSAFGIAGEDGVPQYFVTNAHVCHDSNGEPVDRICILLDSKAAYMEYDGSGHLINVDLNNARTVSCEVVYIEESEYPDIAVLKTVTPIPDRTILPLHRTSAEIKDGATIYALGYPGNVDSLNLRGHGMYLPADIAEVMLTSGIVSKKTNSELLGGTDVIMHTATINHGNSGGPLVDENCAVVGINTYSGEGNQNISIYIDYVIPVLESKGIAFEDADAQAKGGFLSTRNIILIAVMAAVVLLAVALIGIFNKKSNDFVEGQKKEEASQLRIQGVAGYFNGRRFEIPTRMSFGRAPDNSMRYPDKTPGVSGHHCELIRGENNRIFIKDLSSSNGTSVNGGMPIQPNQMVEIRPGDRFYLGSENEGFLLCYKGGKLTVE